MENVGGAEDPVFTGFGNLKRLEGEIEEWEKWLRAERARSAQGEAAQNLLSSLKANKDLAEAMKDPTSPPDLIRQRCDELTSEVYDIAHRYGIHLRGDRGRAGDSPPGVG